MLLARVHEERGGCSEMMASLVTAYDLDRNNQTNLAMMRDCLVRLLVQQREGKGPQGAQDLAGSILRAKEDPEIMEILTDVKIKKVCLLDLWRPDMKRYLQK